MAPDSYHAVEVFGADGYGSGCAVTPSLILTAKHLLGEGEGITVPVRTRSGREGEARLHWRAEDLDLALLRFAPADGAEGEAAAAVTVGRFPSWDEDEREFAMFGWPRAGASRGSDDGWERSPVEVVGEIRLAERDDDEDPIRLRPADRYPALDEGSWWEGMSGAAVFVDGALVGVQIEQPRAEIPGYLAAQPLAGSHPDQQRLLQLLADEGVHAEVALGPRDAALRHHLEVVDEQLAAPPRWFPPRLLDADGVVDRLFQPPALERRTAESGTPINALDDVPAGALLVVLEGPAGSGKSWALAAHTRELAKAALARAKSDDGRFSEPLAVPIWCRLADVPPGASAKEVLTHAIEQMDGDPQLLGGLERGFGVDIRWHLLVDGVDEASEERKETLSRLVDRVLAGGGPLARIVVATRPGELEISAGPQIERVRLEGMGARRQTALIRAWFDDHPSQADAVRVLADHWRLREAFQTPLVLTLTCIAIEGWEDGQPILRSSADVFRAAAATLASNNHRAGGVRPLSAAGQRARNRAVKALTTLASRLFTAEGYQPSLPAAGIDDIDDVALDACIDTGLITLRADGGIDFDNRAIAAYLAAQHQAAHGGWEQALASVWDSEAVAEVATYVPHALTAPLLPVAQPASVEPWFVAADRLAAGGDPGFLLLHTVCRALASIGPSAVPEARARYVQALCAHILSGVDPRAADALASLAPEALAGIAAAADSENRFSLALVLANVGHEDGFAILDDATLEGLDDSTAVAVLEWLARRGTAAGVRRVKQQAQASASPYRRLVCSLILAYWEVDGADELLAASLGGKELSSDLVQLGAAVLAERGDERGIEVLHEMLESSSPGDELRAMLWSPEDLPDAGERLARLADAALEENASDETMEIGLTAMLALVELDNRLGRTYLERLARIDSFDGPALAAVLFLLELDPETGIELLEAQAQGSSDRSLAAACLLLERDADPGAQALLRLAGDDRAAASARIGAARILELHERPEATTALDSVKGVDDDELKMTTGRSAQEAATLDVADTFAELQGMGTDLGETLERLVNALQGFPDVRPSDGVWRDATEDMFLQTDPEAGGGPALLAQFDLDSEVDRRGLAMTIPLVDDPAGRTYMATQAAMTAPSDDWLLLMARWAVGDFSDSIRDERAIDSWREPARRLQEIGPGLAEWAGIAWGDEGWIVGRCLPLVFDHLTARAFLEMAHHLKRPILPGMSRGLIGIDPISGLSEPTVRACTGRACDEGLAHALEGRDEPDAIATREALLARARTLTCVHT